MIEHCRTWVHWDGKKLTKKADEKKDRPMFHSVDEFFASARKPGSVPALDDSALYFNLVKIGGKIPPTPLAP